MSSRLLSAVAIASVLFGSAPNFAVAASLPKLSNCQQSMSVEPVAVTLACGDGNDGLSAMRWTSWTRSSAIGSGTYWWNDCSPNCAAGHAKTHAVTVEVSEPKKVGRDVLFTRLAFVGWKPAGEDAVMNVGP